MRSDDLGVGMLVTVKQWRPREATGFGEGFTTMTYTVHDTSYVGDPLRIVAICLPFVVVEQKNGSTRKIDTRQAELMVISEAYATALGMPTTEPSDA